MLINSNKYMEIKHLIDKWGINQTILGKRLGLTKGAFSNKLNAKYGKYSMNEANTNQLKEILKELSKDIKSLK